MPRNDQNKGIDEDSGRRKSSSVALSLQDDLIEILYSPPKSSASNYSPAHTPSSCESDRRPTSGGRLRVHFFPPFSPRPSADEKGGQQREKEQLRSKGQVCWEENLAQTIPGTSRDRRRSFVMDPAQTFPAGRRDRRKSIVMNCPSPQTSSQEKELLDHWKGLGLLPMSDRPVYATLTDVAKAELMAFVLAFLDWRDLLHAGVVCHRFCKAHHSNALWQDQYERLVKSLQRMFSGCEDNINNNFNLPDQEGLFRKTRATALYKNSARHRSLKIKWLESGMHQRRQPNQNYKLLFSELILSTEVGPSFSQQLRQKGNCRTPQPQQLEPALTQSKQTLSLSAPASPEHSKALTTSVNHTHHPFRHYIRPFSANKRQPPGSRPLSPGHSPIQAVRRRSRPQSPGTVSRLGSLHALALDPVPALSPPTQGHLRPQSKSCPASRRPSTALAAQQPHQQEPSASAPSSSRRPGSGSGRLARSQPGFAVGTVPWIQPQYKAWHEAKLKRTSSYTQRINHNNTQAHHAREEIDKYYEERYDLTTKPKKQSSRRIRTPSGAIVTQALLPRSSSSNLVHFDSTGSFVEELHQGGPVIPPAARLYLHNPRIPGALLAPKSQRVAASGARGPGVFKNTGFEDTRDFTPWNLGQQKHKYRNQYASDVLPKLEIDCLKMSQKDLTDS